MQHEYRGHRIRLLAAEPWRTELVELASGATLPTMVVAEPHESLREVWARSRSLVDLYLDAPGSGRRVPGPVRPFQTFPPRYRTAGEASAPGESLGRRTGASRLS